MVGGATFHSVGDRIDGGHAEPRLGIQPVAARRPGKGGDQVEELQRPVPVACTVARRDGGEVVETDAFHLHLAQKLKQGLGQVEGGAGVGQRRVAFDRRTGQAGKLQAAALGVGLGGQAGQVGGDLGQDAGARGDRHRTVGQQFAKAPLGAAGVEVDRGIGQRQRIGGRTGAQPGQQFGKEIDAGRQVEDAGFGLGGKEGHGASIASASGRLSGRPTSHQPPSWTTPVSAPSAIIPSQTMLSENTSSGHP